MLIRQNGKKAILVLLSVVCFLCAALSLAFYLPADAADAEASEHTDHTGWTELSATGGALADGNYYLATDVTLVNDITITGTVTICLNGYKLTGTGEDTVITIQSGEFTLCDCNSSNGTHYYTKDENGMYVFDGVTAETEGAESLTGGVITGGTGSASKSEFDGGAVLVEANGTFVMDGGALAGNTAEAGGGVYNNGSFILNGGTIAGNYIYKYSGAAVDSNRGDFTMNGGSIYENTASGNGFYGSLYVASGAIVINDGYLDGRVEGSEVKVYGGTFSQTAINDLHELLDENMQFTEGENGFMLQHIHDNSIKFDRLDLALENATEGSLPAGNYYLNRDLTLTETLPITGEVTLCLNGHILRGSGSGSVIVVKGGKLTLCDCNGSQSAHYYIVDANGKYVFDGVTAETKGAKALEGGVITGGTKGTDSSLVSFPNDGGGINVDGGTLIMEGGTLAGNEGYDGGALFAYAPEGSSCTVEIKGGKLVGNDAEASGASAFVHERATLIVSGGVIAQDLYVNGSVQINGGYFGSSIYVNWGNAQIDGGYFAEPSMDGRVETGYTLAQTSPELDSQNFQSGYPYAVYLEGEKLNTNISAEASQETVVYDGKPIERDVDFTVSGDNGVVTLYAYSTDGYTYKPGLPADVGTYIIRVTPATLTDRTYSAGDAATFTLEIAQTELTKDHFDVALPDQLFYNEEEKSASVALKPDYSGAGEITVLYSTTSGSYTEATSTAAVGTYYIFVDVTEGENFAAAEKLEIGSFTVTEAIAQIVWDGQTHYFGDLREAFEFANGLVTTAENRAVISLRRDGTEDDWCDGNIEESSYVTLDLNGHLLYNLEMFDVRGDFVLDDSNPDAEHRFTDEGYRWQPDENGDIFVKGGAITGMVHINIFGGSFTMEGGTFAGCDMFEGILVYAGGSFTMNGGAFAGCDMFEGILVYAGGSFTMNGGAFRGITMAHRGIVNVMEGSFTMNGGEISDCHEGIESVVSLDGYNGESTFTMNGGTISDNTVYQAAVMARYNGSFILNGGMIAENTLEYEGTAAPAVYLWNSSFAMTDGYLGGTVAVQDYDEEPVSSAAVERGNFTQEALDSLNAILNGQGQELIKTGAAEDGYFSAVAVDIPQMTETHTHTDGITFDHIVTADLVSLSRGNYHLAADISLIGDLTITGEVELCLNGYQLTGDITVAAGAKLTVCNCSSTASGELAGTIAAESGATVCLTGGYYNAVLSGEGDVIITGGYFANAPVDFSVAEGYIIVPIDESTGDDGYRDDFPYAVYAIGETSYTVSAAEIVYGQTVVPTIGGNVHNVAVSYVYTGAAEGSGLPTYAGSYTVTATFADYIDGTNKTYYPAAQVTFTVTIGKAAYDMSNVDWTEGSFTYDGSKKTVSLTGLPNGVTANYGGEYTAIDAGDYTATVSFTYDSANYELVDLKDDITSYQWSIAKAMPAYTLPTGLTTCIDHTLADISLPDGWTWDDSFLSVGDTAGEMQFAAVFTPDDTDNYEIVGVDLSVTVTEHSWDEGAVTTQPTCTEEGVRTYTCTNCEVTRTETIEMLAHTPGAAATCTTAQTCMVCGTVLVPSLGHDLISHEVQSPTCTEIGWNAYETCTRCDYTTYEAIPATGHTPGTAVRENEVAPTCMEAGSYEKVVYCSTCDAELSRTEITVAATGHSWGAWTQAKAPTCIEEGMEQRVCENDPSHVETRAIAALGHDLISHEAQAPTCTEIGWNAYETCTRCDYTTYTEIPAAGHTAGTPVRENEVAPTCTEAGSYEEVVYCSVCDAELSREIKSIAATGHTQEAVEGQAATCTESGLTDGSVCSVCGAVLQAQEEIPATGHSWGAWVEIKEAGIGHEGEEQRTCENCGKIESRVIPAEPFPVWAIVLICVGGVALIGGAAAAVIVIRKRR